MAGVVIGGSRKATLIGAGIGGRPGKADPLLAGDAVDAGNHRDGNAFFAFFDQTGVLFYLTALQFEIVIIELIHVDNGVDAQAAIARHIPDLVLLDIMMPKLDGIEVCRRLKTDPALPFLPIIMVTARVEEIDRLLGLELGADDYICKPFSPREVVARVKALLRRA